MTESNNKYDLIIDSLESLLKSKTLTSISVNEIAQNAGIAKGSIYYYFKSKDEIFEALIQRSYRTSIETAKSLVDQTEISHFTRMALIFQTCRNSFSAFIGSDSIINIPNSHEKAYLFMQFSEYLIKELKPVLTDIIKQGIDRGEIHFEHPEELAEISLIVLTSKMNPTTIQESPQDIEKTMKGLIELLEKGTSAPAGSINYLLS